jgi:hypothetical protein
MVTKNIKLIATISTLIVSLFVFITFFITRSSAETNIYCDTTTATCPSTTISTTSTTTSTSSTISISLDDFNVDPDNICIDQDKSIELSVDIRLDNGPDNTLVKAKFYVEDEDGGFDFIDSEQQRLDKDETQTFSVFYDYNNFDRETGIYDVKVVAQAGDEQEIAFSKLRIKDCMFREGKTSVGSISLSPDFPKKGDIIYGSFDVSLGSGRLPVTVDIKGFIDGNNFFSDSRRFNDFRTETFQFTINTNDYSSGTHTLRIEANVDGHTDTSSKSFSIEPFIYAQPQQHCLFVDRIWTDKPLQPGETNRIHVRITSCGDTTEPVTRASIVAFGQVYYNGVFDLAMRNSKDVIFDIKVPQDAEGKTTFETRTWNTYTADNLLKDFIVYTGVPFIDIGKEFAIGQCKTDKITFDLVNTGQVSDTFNIATTGLGSKWITGIPTEIVLDAGERKTIQAYVNVPCDVQEGYYEFTINAEGSPKYSVTSSIHVIKAFFWPTLKFPGFPEGLFLWGLALPLLSWILLIFLILILLILLLAYTEKHNGRRRPMFDCMGHDGC